MTLDSYRNNFDLSQRDNDLKTVLEVAEEMHAREIKITKADIYESDATKFLIKDGEILPPLAAVDDVSKKLLETRSSLESNNFFIRLLFLIP